MSLNRDMDSRKAQFYFFTLLLAAAGVLAVIMILPYLQAIIVAGALAVVFHPVFKKFLILFGDIKILAALATLVAVAVIALLPLSFFGAQVFDEARGLYVEIRSGIESAPLETVIHEAVGKLPSWLQFNPEEQLARMFEWFVGNLGGFFAGTLNILIHFFVGILILYYFLKEGETIKRWIVKMSPLEDKYDQQILERMSGTVSSVMRGSMVVAVVQGVLAWTGLWMFGVPSPALWGSVAAVSALIPGVGTALVMVPAIIYLLISGASGPALGLLLWSVVVVGLVDNFLTPRLVGRGTGIHPVLILLAVLSGIGFFGPLGFLIGPLVFSFLFALLDVYISLSSGTMEEKTVLE